GKMRAYEGQGEHLFQALALAAIILRNSQLSGMSWNLRSVHEPVYGNIVDWDGGDSTTQAAAAQLQQAARTFGRNASRIIARTRDLDQRERLLDSALARSFGPESAQTIAYSLPSVLADVHGSVARPVIATWIAFGEWPRNVERLNLGVEYTPGVIEPVGYSERLKPRARLFDERHYIKYSLYQRHSTVEARRFIDSVSQTAYVELKQSSAPAPLITIGGTGLSPTVEDLLTFAVPVVVFLYALFLVFWQRETSGAVGIPPTGVAFGFPTFSCPADPLRAPCPRGISEFAQRSIWLLFLLLPTLLFDVGATLRYDLVAPAGVLSEWTLFEYLEKLRTHDRLSVFLDFVNLVALALSLMILAKITGVQRAATRS